MNRTLQVVATLSLAFPLAAIAQSTQTASVTAPVSAQEVHELIKSAHTSTQYKELASYYHQQEAGYRAKAAAEKVERDRRAQVDAGFIRSIRVRSTRPRPSMTPTSPVPIARRSRRGTTINWQVVRRSLAASSPL